MFVLLSLPFIVLEIAVIINTRHLEEAQPVVCLPVFLSVNL